MRYNVLKGLYSIDYMTTKLFGVRFENINAEKKIINNLYKPQGAKGMKKNQTNNTN